MTRLELDRMLEKAVADAIGVAYVAKSSRLHRPRAQAHRRAHAKQLTPASAPELHHA